MATSYYDIGTVTLTNGSRTVIGNGTGWQLALIAGGNIFVEAPGNPLPIASVDSDSEITAELAWTGASGTYEYRLQRDSAYMKALDENSRNLSYLLSEIRNGTLFKYDAAGSLADRALHDAKPKGFSYLVFAGETALLYVKASAAEADWSGPFAYGTGPVGPEGPVGFLEWRGSYEAGTAYQENDGVYHNGSAWVALQTTTGNSPPNLPTTENAYWSLLAIKGQDGLGTGDMQAATYDPQNKQADAFSRANHTGDIPDTTVFADTADPTRRGRLDVGAVTAGQSRVYAMPDRDIVVSPTWEQIGAAIVASSPTAQVVWTNLAAYRVLRLRFSMIPSGTIGVNVQTSRDNGLSFDAGATDYSYQGFAMIEGVYSAVPSGNAASMPLVAQAAQAPVTMSGVFEIDSFNKPRFAGWKVDMAYVAVNATRFDRLFGYVNVAATSPRNALRLNVGSGSVTGEFVLEGIRG